MKWVILIEGEDKDLVRLLADKMTETQTEKNFEEGINVTSFEEWRG